MKNLEELKSQLINKVFLLVIFTLLGFSALQAASTDLFIEKTFKVSSGETLTMEVMGGDIKLAAWDKDEVYVKVFANKKAQEKLDFIVEKNSGGVLVKSEKKSSFSWEWNNISSKYEIMVPKEFLLDLKTSGGNIEVDEIIGTKNVKTSGGDINLKNTSGILEAKTSGGNVIIKFNNGEIDVATSGGDIEVYDVMGNISATTSGGNIEIKNSVGEIDAKTSGGDIEVLHKGENKGMKLYTTGGNIKLKLEKSVSADLDLKTTGGNVSCDLSGLKIIEMKSNYLEAKVNGGGNIIKAKTTGGDIDVN